jgi:hypothetical protein
MVNTMSTSASDAVSLVRSNLCRIATVSFLPRALLAAVVPRGNGVRSASRAYPLLVNAKSGLVGRLIRKEEARSSLFTATRDKHRAARMVTEGGHHEQPTWPVLNEMDVLSFRVRNIESTIGCPVHDPNQIGSLDRGIAIRAEPGTHDVRPTTTVRCTTCPLRTDTPTGFRNYVFVLLAFDRPTCTRDRSSYKCNRRAGRRWR